MSTEEPRDIATATSWLESEPARWFVPPNVEIRDGALHWPSPAEPVHPRLADFLAREEARLLSRVPSRERKKREAICDAMRPSPEVWKAVTTSPSLLSDFLEIGTDAQRLERFATKYGPLPWCPDHNAPRTHDPVCFWSFAEHGVLKAESIHVWFDFIALFGAIVRTFDRIQAEAEIDRRDARIIGDFAIPTAGNTASEHIGAEPAGMRSLLAISATKLSRYAGFVPTVAWGIGQDGHDRPKPLFSFGATGWCLFSALVARLLTWILDPKLRCDYCGLLYDQSERQKRPKAGQRSFCKSCRDSGATDTLRSNAYRERKRQRERARYASRKKGVANATKKKPKR